MNNKLKRQIMIYSIIAICIIILDQITKMMILANFREHQTISIIPNFFNLTFVKNSGAAWGIFSQSTLMLTIFSVFILCLFSYMFFKYRDNVVRFCIMLIMSGAIGNLIDRIRLQYVVDFFDFKIFSYAFPVFNVADIMVSLGTIILILYLLTTGDKNEIR